MHDQRKHKRLPVRGFLNSTVSFSHRGMMRQSVSLLSLSAGGMYVAVDVDQVDKGDSMTDIHFQVDALSSLILKGQVVHTMSLGEIGGCGVAFDDVPHDTVLLLEQFVETKLREFGLWESAS